TDVKINQRETRQISDSVKFKGFNLYSFDKLKYRPKALTDAIFIKDSSIYRDIDRSRTLRYLNQLQMFRYPSIEYVENIEDTTLTANIYLSPKKKYTLFFEPEITTSNIQTVGLAFNTGLKVRNVFKGAETLDFSVLTSIGASREGADPGDPFFDIVEFGGNIGLTVPRFFLPFNTDKVVPKYMSPTTRLNLTATSQTNIGLDKQSFSSNLAYNWFPSEKVSNTVDLFNVQFVNNLNPDAFYRVYSTSYNRLNEIARDIGYIGPEENLDIDAGEPEQFIQDVDDGNTSLQPGDPEYSDVINIGERQERLTENNLIVSTSFRYTRDTRENLSDNTFSILRTNVELAGNLLSGLSNLFGTSRNSNGNFELFGVAFSQYIKTEIDYIKYWGLGGKNVLATRSYFGIAIPYGNSNNIPFAKSFFAGGPNDNRAWSAYNLGPGSVQNFDEFSEANLKIHFSVEQRFNLVGSFDGAIFIDAGNIWNVLDNVTTPGATFDSFDSLKDIAVGSGFGLRYDFSFFVARLDTGFKTYNPELEMNRRWFTDFNFKNAVFNIGINYPF
ncbi:MAG: BamA/TamA family outer membrane protein, partial [Bacteroidota bacterium]